MKGDVDPFTVNTDRPSDQQQTSDFYARAQKEYSVDDKGNFVAGNRTAYNAVKSYQSRQQAQTSPRKPDITGAVYDDSKPEHKSITAPFIPQTATQGQGGGSSAAGTFTATVIIGGALFTVNVITDGADPVAI